MGESKQIKTDQSRSNQVTLDQIRLKGSKVVNDVHHSRSHSGKGSLHVNVPKTLKVLESISVVIDQWYDETHSILVKPVEAGREEHAFIIRKVLHLQSKIWLLDPRIFFVPFYNNAFNNTWPETKLSAVIMKSQANSDILSRHRRSTEFLAGRICTTIVIEATKTSDD